MSKIFFRDFGSWQIPLAIEQRFGAEATLAHKVKTNKNLTSTFLSGWTCKRSEGDYDSIASLYSTLIFLSLNVPNSWRWNFLVFESGLIYDTRDSAINPRNGVLANVRFDQDIDLSSGFENTFTS